MLDTSQLIRLIHSRPLQLVLAVTGGGSGAVSALLQVPGASRTVLEAAVPYAPEALARWLGWQPDASCTERIARLMAMAAFERGRQYRQHSDEYGPDSWVGVGCTASLASDRPKRGAHRVHLAVQTANYTQTVSLEFHKGHRDRGGEEQTLAGMILNLVAEAAGLTERLPLSLLVDEQPCECRVAATAELRELLLGQRQFVACHVPPQQRPAVLFPGAFHPLHEGHRHMAAVAGERLGLPVAFELSIHNVDKPPLDYIEIDERARQFSAPAVAESTTASDGVGSTCQFHGPGAHATQEFRYAAPLYLTQAPTFVEKARLFEGATFVVGLDTIERIADARYYGDSLQARDAAVAELAARGCRFLVFPRLRGDEFKRLAEAQLPPGLAALCEEVPDFRYDVSSTQIRRQEL